MGLYLSKRDPQGPQRNRIFDEKLVVEEVGGTCDNVMYMLAHFGWEAFPVTNLDRSEEALEKAQIVASKSVSFIGSKGMISQD